MTKFKTLGQEPKEKKKTVFVEQVVRATDNAFVIKTASRPEHYEVVTLIAKGNGETYDTFLAEDGGNNCIYLGHAGYEFD